MRPLWRTLTSLADSAPKAVFSQARKLRNRAAHHDKLSNAERQKGVDVLLQLALMCGADPSSSCVSTVVRLRDESLKDVQFRLAEEQALLLFCKTSSSFEVHHVLGTGSYGVVYLVRSRRWVRCYRFSRDFICMKGVSAARMCRQRVLTAGILHRTQCTR